VLNESELERVFAALCTQRAVEHQRLARIRRYVRGEQLELYVPNGAGAEFRRLIEQAHFNILPRVVSAVTQDLYVDGFRPTTTSGRVSADNSPLWAEVWQPNRLDARQSGLFRAAVTYGAAYATVLPGRPSPVVKCYSPRRCTAIYGDPSGDEWPVYAMTVDRPDVLTRIDVPALRFGDLGVEQTDPRLHSKVRVWDDTHVYTLRVHETAAPAAAAVSIEEHGLGVCPVVRFLDSVDLDADCPPGKVEPLLHLQDQIDQTTFSLLMTQQYQAFRQRWATGMAIDVDELGRPIQPWNASVAEVWVNESPDGRFGDFAETSLAGYLESRRDQLLFATSVAQIPPHQLVIGNAVSNISADALVALETAHRQDVAEHQVVLGEALEQLMRLAGRAHGMPEAWDDLSAQVVWRDTTPRSLAQIADALGKLATQLEIPARALWERIPGVSDQDLGRWEQMREQDSPMVELRQMLTDPMPEPMGPEVPADVDGASRAAPAQS